MSWTGKMRGVSVLLACGCALAGCPVTTPTPCEVDPVGCKNANSIPIQCQRAGTLDVQIGTGETAFTAIDASHGFAVHHGTQGGEHVFGAIRVTNPALDFPQLLVEFQLFDADGGEIGYRKLALGPPLTIVNGAAEQAGIVVFGSVLESGRTMHVNVSDPCGRVGQADIPFHQ